MEPIKYFLSYSRQNSQFVLKLATDLKIEGIKVWLDQVDIALGSKWDDSIEAALNKSSGFIVILSLASVKSQNVMDEVSYAIAQGKRIVPVMIEKCAVPFRLARFQYIDFTGNYDISFQQLINSLEIHRTTPGKVTGEREIAVNEPSQVKLLSKDESNTFETRREEGNLTSSLIRNLGTLTGILFIVLAVMMTLLNRCPTSVQYFIIYALTGIGIALLLAKSAERTTANININNVGIALGGGVALPFILFFINPIGSIKADDCHLRLSATSTTVFVQGKKGKQDMILRQKGFVIMDIGGERKRASINENGQAFFQNLHAGDSVRLDIDFSEPYKTIYPDSVYVIQPNSNIYLPVALQGIDKVNGRVLYNDAPLEGVTVQIDTISTLTDKTGRFNVPIPESFQRDKYQVWFIKQGFKTRSATATPQIGEPLEVVMEK